MNTLNTKYIHRMRKTNARLPTSRKHMITRNDVPDRHRFSCFDWNHCSKLCRSNMPKYIKN